MLLIPKQQGGQEVVVTRRTNWGVYQIVKDGGGYCISLNGEPIRCFHWRIEELGDCVRSLERLVDTDDVRD